MVWACLSVHTSTPPPPRPTHTHPTPIFLDLDSVSNKFIHLLLPRLPLPPPPPPPIFFFLIWIQSIKITYPSPPNPITAPPPHPRHFPHFFSFITFRHGFQNNFAMLVSSRRRSAVQNICLRTLKVKVTLEGQMIKWS